jgi:hypothetical protein
MEGIPLPPPWKEHFSESGELLYVNEVTNEQSAEFPLLKISKFISENEFSEDNFDSSLYKKSVDNFTFNSFIEFRCQWQEKNVQGDTLRYNLFLRYFNHDEHFEIKFDTIDGIWAYSYLEGSYGPISKYDLFVGAKIKLFGRNLTIQNASASFCRWIDDTAIQMKERRLFLQNKIENIGVKAVVPREMNQVTRNIIRDSDKAGGRTNLRKLYIEISLLEKQLCDNGFVNLLRV